MGKLPVLSGHELIKILKKIGFEPDVRLNRYGFSRI